MSTSTIVHLVLIVIGILLAAWVAQTGHSGFVGAVMRLAFGALALYLVLVGFGVFPLPVVLAGVS